MTKDEKKIGPRIRSVRTRYKISQANLADYSGLTEAAISQIESSKRIPTIISLKKIARELNVSIDYLVGASEEERFYGEGINETKPWWPEFMKLSEKDQEFVVDFVIFLKQRTREKKKQRDREKKRKRR